MNATKRRELEAIFGDVVTSMASIIEPECLTITPLTLEAVHRLADEVQALQGNPHKQAARIAGQNFAVRLVLCWWMQDTKMAAKLVRLTYASACA